MLKIRLKRTGRKKQPFYKISLMESLARRDGKSLAEFGYYNPISKELQLNKNLILKYIKNGAKPTNTVRHLIYKHLEQLAF